MKTIGVIGGMGTQATVDLFSKIVSNTKAEKDQDHVHVIIDNNAEIPDRTQYILTGENNPFPFILEAAQRLEQLQVDYIAMPCNTAHYFYEALSEQVSVPVINMIEETAIATKEMRFAKVLLLATEGTYKSQLYRRYFQRHGIRIQYPDVETQKAIHDLIYTYKKTGRVNARLRDRLHLMFQEQQWPAIVLGCTELPLLFEGKKYIDPTLVLARICIEKAGKACIVNENLHYVG